MPTLDEIHAAADALVLEGKKPTLSAVRAIVGGSYSTLSPALARWRNEQQTTTSPTTDSVSPVVSHAWSNIRRKIVKHAWATKNAQHTPGPWFPTKASCYNQIASIGKAWNISTMLPLADLGDVDADARLIAAAPEMLSALQAVLAEIEGPERPYSTDSWLPKHLVYQVRSAIAKVEGVAA